MTDAVATLRRFNRFHTRLVGALDRHYQGSELSLPEARLLYELATRDAPLASEIGVDLGIDAGYLSRTLRRFEERGWVARGRGGDARKRPILLTDDGRARFDALDARSREDVERLLAPLLEADRHALSEALGLAESLLGGRSHEPVSIRTFRPGDMGSLTARQAILYAENYGWGVGLESLIGEVTAHLLRDFKPGREQAWIAEIGGVMAGSVLLVDAGDNVGQLRLLYVESWARGRGIGEALVSRCVEMARAAGYRELMLWTHTVLTSARRIYAAAGLEIRSVEVHDEFGEPVQGEIWAMPLDGQAMSGQS